MSRGLGRIERTILDALQAASRPYVELWQLVLLVEGRITSLDQEVRHWGVPICAPHPRVRHPLPGIGMVDHLADCYPPEPTRGRQEGVGRAVRSLTRKGLLHSEYGLYGKRVVVCLPGTDPAKLPKGERWELELKLHVCFGKPLPVTRFYERRYYPRRRPRDK
jgi:hypothetical protein